MTHTTNPDNQFADLDSLRAALVELTPAQQTAAEALAVGSTHAVAAEASGVARETVTRWAGHHPAFRAALNLYRATLVAEQADTARRIRGRALAVVESGLDTADVPTALAILRAVPTPPADAEGMTEPSAILDAETRHTRANLPPVSLPRDEFGLPDVLAGMAGPTEDERADELTLTRLNTAAGLDAQRATVTAALAHRGWNLAAAFVDEGRSGASLNRPALAEALDRLDHGEADALVVAKLDRLSRSVLDFAAITERAKRRGWAVVALDVDVDMTTPTGELVANITSSVAQWERRIIGARTSEAMQAMKARGVRLGRPVELADHVRQRIAAERADGDSLRTIAARLNAEAVATARGGRWHASTVRAVLDSLALDAHAQLA